MIAAATIRRTCRRTGRAAFRRCAVMATNVGAAALLLLAAFAFIPGDPISAAAGEAAPVQTASPWNWGEASFLLRFEKLLEAVIRGDFAFSLHYDGVTVADIVRQGLAPTLILSLGALATAAAPGIAVGLWASMAGPRAAAATTVLFTVCLSLPVAVAAAALVYALSIFWRLTPTAGWGDLPSAVSPILALALPMFGHIGRAVWALAAEAAASPHVRAARAKGLSRWAAARRHVLGNIAGPLAAHLSTAFAALLSGTLLVETLFSVPGLGRETVKATLNRDYPVIMGGMLTLIMLNAVAGLAAELLRVLSDPRGDERHGAVRE
jgi:ABC-type dipeptide/oligopeptide/nickel transport system permease component